MSKNGASAEEKLPVHGFVLAGGKSSRMGTDKALMEFCGRPLVEIAVEKLRTFCAAVSIVGERADLVRYAPVVTGERANCGPGAGIEAGLRAATQEWCLFVPVDVPLVPGDLLRKWAEATVREVSEFEETAGSLLGSSLYTKLRNESAFAMLRPEVEELFHDQLDKGERRLSVILGSIRTRFGDARYLRVDAAWHTASIEHEKLPQWFANVNTPENLADAETWAAEQERSIATAIDIPPIR